MFERVGRQLGYRTRRSWTRALPTDGVWVVNGHPGLSDLPLVALEVAVSEDPKQTKGSIGTLVEVSPALGLVVVHEEEIRRSLTKKGVGADEIQRRIIRKRTQVEA